MRSATKSVDIDADPREVFAVVSDLSRLPEWSTAFAREIVREGGRDFVVTPGGQRVGIRVRADRDLGVVDYLLTFAPGLPEVPASTRVLPRGEGSAYVFTLLQDPAAADELFEQQAGEVQREIDNLKRLVEGAGAAA